MGSPGRGTGWVPRTDRAVLCTGGARSIRRGRRCERTAGASTPDPSPGYTPRTHMSSTLFHDGARNTRLSRRRLLKVAGWAGIGAALAVCGIGRPSSSAPITRTPARSASIAVTPSVRPEEHAADLLAKGQFVPSASVAPSPRKPPRRYRPSPSIMWVARFSSTTTALPGRRCATSSPPDRGAGVCAPRRVR